MFVCLKRVPTGRDATGAAASRALEAVAGACSPRVMRVGLEAVLFDVGGLTRAIGAPAAIAREVSQLAESHGLECRLALAGTMTTAWLLAQSTPGVTVAPVAPRAQAAAVSTLPLSSLSALPDFRTPNAGAGFGRPDRPVGPAKAGPGRRHRGTRGRHFRLAPGPDPLVFGGLPPVLSDVDAHLTTLARWGLRTLGDLARLPRADLHARLGDAGVRLHLAASGDDAAPLVPDRAAPRFVERLELEWPIEGLEPLAFVLARLCEVLSMTLEQADRGAIGLTTRLQLVSKATYERVVRMPAPMRDARVLRTLIQLDLESHPPSAGIDVVEVEAEVAPGAIEQGSLLARAMPAPGQLETLIARLRALLGESRVGAPALVDTHDDRAVALAPFAPPGLAEPPEAAEALPRVPGFRRFRLPVAARVSVARGLPARVQPSARGLSGGEVVAAAGPWRSSGRWWSLEAPGWDRDEWDVEVTGGHLYRLSRDRASGAWAIEGAVD